MFDSIEPKQELAADPKPMLYYSFYGVYCLLGAFGAVRAFFWRHGPTHVLQAVLFFAVFVLSILFLLEAIKKGPRTPLKLHRRWLLLFVLSMVPVWLKTLLM